jgi:hypothetical protein
MMCVSGCATSACRSLSWPAWDTGYGIRDTGNTGDLVRYCAISCDHGKTETFYAGKRHGVAIILTRTDPTPPWEKTVTYKKMSSLSRCDPSGGAADK